MRLIKVTKKPRVLDETPNPPKDNKKYEGSITLGTGKLSKGAAKRFAF